MGDILYSAKDLSLKLQKEGSYLNYINAKNKLKQNKPLFDKVLEFKNNQINDCFQEDFSFNRENYMAKLYSDLMLIDDSRDFLNYEGEFLKIYSEAIEAISEDLDIELYGLD
ncbi:MAG: YlbF family regulator [Clostridiales bacterium]|jgi:hypothetical protein|nr:YlbF family regulator [Clostridiales bacterium]